MKLGDRVLQREQLPRSSLLTREWIDRRRVPRKRVRLLPSLVEAQVVQVASDIPELTTTLCLLGHPMTTLGRTPRLSLLPTTVLFCLLPRNLRWKQRLFLTSLEVRNKCLRTTLF